MILFYHAFFIILILLKAESLALDSKNEVEIASFLHRSGSDTVLKTFEVTESVSRNLLDHPGEESDFTYHHYACVTKDKRDIKDIYAQLIKKGGKILHHLYTTTDLFLHQFNILEQYLDFSPYCLQHGFTFGGISLLNGPSQDQLKEQNAYLESIISVIWALVDKSFKRGDIFDRGAIILVDPAFKVLEFLKGYALEVSGCKDWEEFESQKNAFLKSNRAYSRTGENWYGLLLSSHFVGKTKFQAGIDCRFGPSERPMPFFPFSMRHLLFGEVTTLDGKIVTFIKPEPSGLADWCSFISHGFNYFWNPQGYYLRREKDIPEDIAFLAFQLVKNLLEMPPNNLNNFPPLTTFKDLQSKNSLTLKTFMTSEKIDIASLWVLTKMIHSFDDTLFPEKLRLKAFNLEDKISETYKDNLSFRTGNEVLFTSQDLIN